MFEGTKQRMYLILRYFLTAVGIGLITGIFINSFQTLIRNSKNASFTVFCLITVFLFVTLCIFLIFITEKIRIVSKIFCLFTCYIVTAFVMGLTNPLWFKYFVKVKDVGSQSVSNEVTFLAECQVFYVTFLVISAMLLVVCYVIFSVIKIHKLLKETKEEELLGGVTGNTGTGVNDLKNANAGKTGAARNNANAGKTGAARNNANAGKTATARKNANAGKTVVARNNTNAGKTATAKKKGKK